MSACSKEKKSRKNNKGRLSGVRKTRGASNKKNTLLKWLRFDRCSFSTIPRFAIFLVARSILGVVKDEKRVDAD